MIFSPKQIQKIIGIIQKNQAVFIGSKLGLTFLSKFQIALLKSYGVDVSKFKGTMSEIDRAFYFGMMAQSLGGLKSFKVTKKNFEEFFQDKMNSPSNLQRDNAIAYVKQRAYTDLSGLGNKTVNNLSNRILTASVAKRKKMEKQIKDKVTKGVIKNWSAQQLASELRHETEDWARDFSRIADYVLQEAYAFGRAQEILENYGDDAMVYKQTFIGVCKPCEKNYGIPGEEPVVYELGDLLANGNNIGRKDQLPVVGNAHPWARSILHVVPDGSKWDKATKRFVIKRDTQGVKRISKVKVTITP